MTGCWQAKVKKAGLLVAMLLSLFILSSCSLNNNTAEHARNELVIDGSSTVYPITAAIAEEYSNDYPQSKITISVSGTGGGFKKATAGEIDINNASRPIKDDEKTIADANRVELIPLSIALDGLAIAVNPNNNFVDSLTVEELSKIWEQGSTIQYWDEVRPEWPHQKLKLYGPGVDSGTYDYFTDVITGGSSRADYQASSDDNVLVVGVAGDLHSLGYFGFAYYEENMDKLRVVPIDGGNGAVAPTIETIRDGSYAPLSRPVFIYVNKEKYENKQITSSFVDYFFDHVQTIAPEVGYVALPDELLDEQKMSLEFTTQ